MEKPKLLLKKGPMAGAPPIAKKLPVSGIISPALSTGTPAQTGSEKSAVLPSKIPPSSPVTKEKSSLVLKQKSAVGLNQLTTLKSGENQQSVINPLKLLTKKVDGSQASPASELNTSNASAKQNKGMSSESLGTPIKNLNSVSKTSPSEVTKEETPKRIEKKIVLKSPEISHTAKTGVPSLNKIISNGPDQLKKSASLILNEAKRIDSSLTPKSDSVPEALQASKKMQIPMMSENTSTTTKTSTTKHSDIKQGTPQLKLPQLSEQSFQAKQEPSTMKKVEIFQSAKTFLPIQRETTYNATVLLSEAKTEDVTITSAPDALIKGIIESLDIADSIGQDLQYRQAVANREQNNSNFLFAVPNAIVPRQGVTYSAYTQGGQYVSPVGPPPLPVLDKQVLAPIRGTHRQLPVSSKHNSQAFHSNLLSNLQSPNQHSAFQMYPRPMRESTVGQNAPYSPSTTAHGRCPTCGVNPSVMVQSEFSQYQLPSDPSLAWNAQKQKLSRIPRDTARPTAQDSETMVQRRPPVYRTEKATKFSPTIREPYGPHITKRIGESPWRQIEKDLNSARATGDFIHGRPGGQLPDRNFQTEIQNDTESDVSSGPPSPRTYKFGPKYRPSPPWAQEFHSSHDRRKKNIRTHHSTVKFNSAVRGGHSGVQSSRGQIKNRQTFQGGLTTYRRSPYRSLSDMATYYTHLEVEDQADVISLLLSCRKLEKQIEEQHVVIDMLDHDLRQAQQTLRFPPEWKQFTDLDLSGVPPADVAKLPDGMLPLYLKGRVLLQQRQPPPGATYIIEPDMARAIAISTESGATKDSTQPPASDSKFKPAAPAPATAKKVAPLATKPGLAKVGAAKLGAAKPSAGKTTAVPPTRVGVAPKPQGVISGGKDASIEKVPGAVGVKPALTAKVEGSSVSKQSPGIKVTTPANEPLTSKLPVNNLSKEDSKSGGPSTLTKNEPAKAVVKTKEAGQPPATKSSDISKPKGPTLSATMLRAMEHEDGPVDLRPRNLDVDEKEEVFDTYDIRKPDDEEVRAIYNPAKKIAMDIECEQPAVKPKEVTQGLFNKDLSNEELVLEPPFGWVYPPGTAEYRRMKTIQVNPVRVSKNALKTDNEGSNLDILRNILGQPALITKRLFRLQIPAVPLEPDSEPIADDVSATNPDNQPIDLSATEEPESNLLNEGTMFLKNITFDLPARIKDLIYGAPESTPAPTPVNYPYGQIPQKGLQNQQPGNVPYGGVPTAPGGQMPSPIGHYPPATPGTNPAGQYGPMGNRGLQQPNPGMQQPVPYSANGVPNQQQNTFPGGQAGYNYPNAGQAAQGNMYNPGGNVQNPNVVNGQTHVGSNMLLISNA